MISLDQMSRQHQSSRSRPCQVLVYSCLELSTTRATIVPVLTIVLNTSPSQAFLACAPSAATTAAEPAVDAPLPLPSDPPPPLPLPPLPAPPLPPPPCCTCTCTCPGSTAPAGPPSLNSTTPTLPPFPTAKFLAANAFNSAAPSSKITTALPFRKSQSKTATGPKSEVRAARRVECVMPWEGVTCLRKAFLLEMGVTGVGGGFEGGALPGADGVCGAAPERETGRGLTMAPPPPPPPPPGAATAPATAPATAVPAPSAPAPAPNVPAPPPDDETGL